MTVEEVLSKLSGVRRNGGGWMARCPGHQDRNPSLSITAADNKVLLHCHAGCALSEILGVLNLKERDLFNDSSSLSQNEIVAAYVYTDSDGRPVGRVCRTKPKGFFQQKPDGHDGWVNGGFRPVLFNLVEVKKAKSILLVEGERDVETARTLGLVATTNPMGAGKWRPEYSAHLKGKRVAIVPDQDEQGRRHAQDVARSLVGVAECVRLIETLPGGGVKDLSDFAAKFPDAATCKKMLLASIRDTVELTASDVARWQPEKVNGFTLTLLSELLAKPDAPVDYLLDGRLVVGTVSGVFAKPKVGKGTLARNLSLAVARGEDFLGLSTKKGECIYLALEEREEDIKRDFRAMGADGTEPILIHAAAAPVEGIGALCDLVRERKPRLVVIDPIIRLARIKDEKAYAETYTALGPLIDAARETGTHVMLLHHSGKSVKRDPTDSPLGTTAIAGAVASLMVLKRTEGYRTIQTVQRIGEEMPETVLNFDPESRTLTLGESKSKAEEERISEAMVHYLRKVKKEQTEFEILNEVEGRQAVKKAAIRALFAAGKVTRQGTGKKGAPFTYAMPEEMLNAGTQYIQGTRKQESESVGQTRENTGEMLVPEEIQNPMLVPDEIELGGE